MSTTDDLVKVTKKKITLEKTSTEVAAKNATTGNSEEKVITPVGHSRKISRVKSRLVKSGSSLKTALIIAKKGVQIMFRYPGEIIVWILMPLMWLVPFIFQGQALLGSDFQSEHFEKFTGTADVLSFIFIGALLWNILDGAIWGAGNTLRWEQHSGTLQFLWLAPISRTDLLVGASLSTTVWSLINVSVQFAILSIFVSWQVTILDILLTLLILIFVIIGLFGFSFAFAAVILMFKEPGVLTEFFDSMLYICSPIRYPIEVLPKWVKWIAWAMPFTWGLISIQALLLTNDSILSMLYLVGILIAIDVVFWLVGYFLFRLAERRTLKRGDLGAF